MSFTSNNPDFEASEQLLDEDDLDAEASEQLLDKDDLDAEASEQLLDKDDLGTEANALLPYVKNALRLSDKEAQNLKKRLWCFSASLRQPRKDVGSCNKTPFFHRWDTNTVTSYLTRQDPRYASQQECQKVCATLLALLLEADKISSPQPPAISTIESVLGRQFRPQSLTCIHTGKPISGDDIKLALGYATQRLGAYEIPVSYRVELNVSGRHEHTNVGWMKPLHINYKLRRSLQEHLRESGASNQASKNALDKIQVKAYCTDKVTMPPHYSNRDFRWATWSSGIQYASHYQCAMIEMELIAQLYEFEGAPVLEKDLLSDLASEVAAVRGKPILPRTRKCFVTGKLLNYTDYVQAAINPKGGRSKYHVGHILPLTRGGSHAWDNIAWASDDGNRIQGNDTVEEIEAKLVNAVEYHLRRDIEMVNPPQVFYEKVQNLWNVLNDIRAKLGKSKIPW